MIILPPHIYKLGGQIEIMIPQYTFAIDLPVNTSKEVLDWFVYMNNTKQLSVELIELVNKNLKSGYNNKSIYNSEAYVQQIINMKDKQTDLQENFINNLYNWQEATSAIFKETNTVKKETKKMLSI